MDMATITLLMFGVMVLLLCTGLPVAFVIGSVGIIFAYFLWGPGGLSMVIYPTYGLSLTFLLAAVPLFIFMGLILQKSGIADDLFEAMYKWAGGLRGGMAVGTVIVCAIIAAMVGISGAATVAMGLIALPAMLKRNYSKYLATGTIQAGGALGLLIPPSIPFLVYAFVAQQSAGMLFASGVLPGLLLCSLYIVYILVRSALQPELAPALPPEERATLREKMLSLKALVLPFAVIFSVMACVVLGITTITEASVIGALGAMVAATVQRKLTFRMIRESLERTTIVTAMVMWIALAAVCFGSIYTGLGAAKMVKDVFLGLGLGPWGVLICMQLSFFVLGMFLDDTAILFLTVPLYLPIVKQLGFDPLWFGTLFVINMQMAFLTPPYGLNLFYMKGVVPRGITMTDLYWSVWPFVLIQAVGLALVMIFPQIALWLPNAVFR
ncbi:MAG TPA: TRAP transporter large permease subunit [Syntrophales bacterium]|nr:TRAP transporter large permease subunit [Syntrophales bacterium]HQN78810.1 TRAP transporter large permease subunit [Syntrophales bacterium]HQQ27862.1 TRAP transporter large permease subunit [Syntrophales bacterium]